MAPRIKRHANGPEVRKWALSLSEEEKRQHGIQGLEISNRGRFHSRIVNAYNKAHRQQGIKYIPISRNVPLTDEVLEEFDKPEEAVAGGEVYRQPRQDRPESSQGKKTKESQVPPTPLPLPQTTVGGSSIPPEVMAMLRGGHPVAVVYVPVEMAATA